jgi:hypothetical protein
MSSRESLLSDDHVSQLKAVTRFANLLSIGSHDLIEEVLQLAQIFPPLVKFLNEDDNPQLQVLTNAFFATCIINTGLCKGSSEVSLQFTIGFRKLVIVLIFLEVSIVYRVQFNSAYISSSVL